jgi:1-acyl-sn-glycerol-3-phosphate acyltransferase
MKIYCRESVVNFDTSTTYNQPKIIASNHPNSFFDAIVIAVKYPQPIYFLARGDAFKKPLVAKFLTALQLVPIYRLSEGKSNLIKNKDTFQKCISLLKQNQTILIFSEGICINEWQLRTLKKGTARLALMAVNENISNLRIQPTNLNYSSFDKNPKEILLNFNSEFEVSQSLKNRESAFYSNFNRQLKQGLLDKLIIQTDKKQLDLFPKKKSLLFKIVLALPAFFGYLLNYGIYSIFKKIAYKKTKNTVFYDSVLFGLLLIFYPVIVTIISILIGVLFNFKIATLLFIVFPFTGWCYSMFKK